MSPRRHPSRLRPSHLPPPPATLQINKFDSNSVLSAPRRPSSFMGRKRFKYHQKTFVYNTISAGLSPRR